MAQVVGTESVAVAILCAGRVAGRFVVAHPDGGAWVRGEGDGLLFYQVYVLVGVVGLPLTAEVKLVVRLAWETDDVGLRGMTVHIVEVRVVSVVVLPVLVGIVVATLRVTVVVVPQELVGVLLVAYGFGIGRGWGDGVGERSLVDTGDGVTIIVLGLCETAVICYLAQPVLVAVLRARVVVAAAAATVEVGELTLVLCAHNLGCERQADGLPALCHVNVAGGATLVPHTLAAGHRVFDGAVEVVLVYEEVVGRSGVARAAGIPHDAVAAHLVDVGKPVHTAVALAALAILRLLQAVGHGRVGRGSGISGSGCRLRYVDEQVVRDVVVYEVEQTVVIEQWRIPGTLAAGHVLIAVGGDALALVAVGHVVVAREVDGRQAYEGFARAVLRL